MCSAASPTRISLDLLPNTSVRAASDGLHACARRGSSGSCGQPAPRSTGERPALRCTPQLLHRHFYPSKNIPAHPGT